MQEAFSIIDELEEAVSSGSTDKRVNTLRRVTDLFLHNGERLSDDQVRVFDDVLCHLVTRVETRVKAELSGRLASLQCAPSGVIERLAWDDEIAVAGAVLTEFEPPDHQHAGRDRQDKRARPPVRHFGTA